ncbi:MAG: DNA ligase D [Verrucomicrobiota bacterium JB022]|nr:DNA ligase D [Verrucomicrobiota bacterium JB022]
MLETYQRKRNFQRTPEPAGRSRGGRAGAFVIQQHDARRMHYDLRLELNGRLLSWAVPKGPSLDPSERRLAVRTEDHPTEYLDFEGVIPEGNYGAGSMIVWDTGRWKPDAKDPEKALKAGKLKFTLQGEKLHGQWELVRTRMGKDSDKENWLLFKLKDDYAEANGAEITQREPKSVKSGHTVKDLDADAVEAESDRAEALDAHDLPKLKRIEFTPPQLATLVDQVPAGRNWWQELKFDGYRIQAIRRGGEVCLWSRNEKDWTDRMPEVAKAVAELPGGDFVLDGEVVVLDTKGRSRFSLLQRAMKHGHPERLRYFGFDLLAVEGRDTRALPLTERKALLTQLLEGQEDTATVRLSEHFEGKGKAFFGAACKQELEGIICKDPTQPYEPGRSRRWVKVKCERRQEFIIAGYTDPQGTRKGFGALLMAQQSDDGLVYRGKVGTGFDHRTLVEMTERLEQRVRKTSPLAHALPTEMKRERVHWVRPDLVAEVRFAELTHDGYIRQGSFQGLREDKAADEVQLEQPQETPEPPKKMSATTAALKKKPTAKSSSAAEVKGVAVSHPERVIFPEAGLTKLELVQLYAELAPRILPYLERRPLSLVRCPQGRAKACFFQKHFEENQPPYTHSVEVEEKSGRRQYLYVTNEKGILSLVQYGVIEFHLWGSRVDNVDKPDQIIFDLDPDPGVTWEEVLGATFFLRDKLAEWGLPSFVKLSGGKGVHVMVPLVRRWGWDVVKAFSRAVSEQMVKAAPDKLIATASKAKRKGKIFVDYLRNGSGATCVTAYGVRARAGAPISMPVAWGELKPQLKPDAFRPADVAARLKKPDPWKDFHDSRAHLKQSLLKTLKVPH